uniref:Uncharacterized protein n=1 Tax=viral metagenome TaxID=1070528 RepID=A0A6C0IUB5_9ZZZZ
MSDEFWYICITGDKKILLRNVLVDTHVKYKMVGYYENEKLILKDDKIDITEKYNMIQLKCLYLFCSYYIDDIGVRCRCLVKEIIYPMSDMFCLSEKVKYGICKLDSDKKIISDIITIDSKSIEILTEKDIRQQIADNPERKYEYADLYLRKLKHKSCSVMRTTRGSAVGICNIM